MNNVVFGIIAGVALFFAVKQSRTFFIKEGGGIGVLEEFDLADIPVRLPAFNPSFTISSPDIANPLFNPENFA